MRRILLAVIVVFSLVAFGNGAAQAQRDGLPPHKDKAVCTAANGPNSAACTARVVTQTDGVTPLATSTYQNGYAPANLISAYNLPASPATATPKVAIVDAYDNPNAENDLAA